MIVMIEVMLIVVMIVIGMIVIGVIMLIVAMFGIAVLDMAFAGNVVVEVLGRGEMVPLAVLLLALAETATGLCFRIVMAERIVPLAFGLTCIFVVVGLPNRFERFRYLVGMVIMAGVGKLAAQGAFRNGMIAVLVGMGVIVVLRMRSITDRNAVVIGMNFGEGQEGMAIAAILDERGLERRLDPRHLCQIDIALELFAELRLVVEFLYAGSIDDGDPGFLGVRRIDQHAPGH